MRINFSENIMKKGEKKAREQEEIEREIDQKIRERASKDHRKHLKRF